MPIFLLQTRGVNVSDNKQTYSVSHELLSMILSQMELDWHVIDEEYGGGKGDIDEAISSGKAEAIRQLRNLLGKESASKSEGSAEAA